MSVPSFPLSSLVAQEERGRPKESQLLLIQQSRLNGSVAKNGASTACLYAAVDAGTNSLQTRSVVLMVSTKGAAYGREFLAKSPFMM